MTKAAKPTKSCKDQAASSHATAAAKDKYRILVVGGGSAGLSVSNQLVNKFRSEGKPLSDGDVAVLDAAEFHHYQVWF